MHFPINFHLGSFEIESHLVFEILAYTLGYRYYLYLRRRSGDVLPAEQRLWVVIGGAFGAAVGSKLLGFLDEPLLWALARQNPMYYFVDKTIVGGLLGGLIGVEFMKKHLGVTRSTGDLFVFPVILGMAIGRIGCFMAGVEDATWGLPTDSWLGIDGGDGILRHPAPLYDIAFLLALGGALAWLKLRVTLREGALFRIFMASYLLWRFGIDFLKPMHAIAPLGISAIQLACLLGLVYYRRVLFCPRTLLETS